MVRDKTFVSPTRLKIGGVVFLSCLSFRNSVILSETLTLLKRYLLNRESWSFDIIFNISSPSDKSFEALDKWVYVPTFLNLQNLNLTYF